MVSVVAALGLASMLVTAAAQDYPSRTVTIIVPYPAGGPTDETARMVAQSLSSQLKQSFIVEDIGGGGAIIGSEKVARAAPDGYTLLVHNLQIAANVSLYENLPFDTVKTFTPVMLINRNPLVLVGRKSLEPSTLRDLVALMKQQTLKGRFPATARPDTSPPACLRKKPALRSIKFHIAALPRPSPTCWAGRWIYSLPPHSRSCSKSPPGH